MIMDIGLLIPPAGRSAAQPNSSLLSETGQCQQPTQGGTFSALLEDAVKNTLDGQTPPLSDTDNPIEPVPSTVMDGHATEAALIDIAVTLFSQVPDVHEVAALVVERVEPLPNPTGGSLQGVQSIPQLLQELTVAAPHDAITLGDASVPTGPPQAGTADSSINARLQPALDRDQSNESATTDEDSSATNKPVIWNGRGASSNLAPVSLEQPSGDLALPNMQASDSLTADRLPAPGMKEQGSTNLLPAASVNRNVQLPDRPSTVRGPSAIIQAQGEPEGTLLGQALSVPVSAGNGGGGQDPFGASAQGGGEGALFQLSANGVPESVMRGNQPTSFNDQLMSARQTQSSPQGAGPSVLTSATEHLKLTQAFLGDEHSAAMTLPRGMVQTVQMELPSHDAGPLSVRISMVDQMVHTQFTTERSDLGAILIARQDQLLQNLTKSGLELGQFQVHINQEGRQDAFPDRQSRRNGEAPVQQPSEDHSQQAQDPERPNHRPTRVLSLFA